MKILLNILGLALSLGICCLLSYNRKAIPWKKIGIALAAELIMAFIIVKVPLGQKAVTVLSDGITAIDRKSTRLNSSHP